MLLTSQSTLVFIISSYIRQCNGFIIKLLNSYTVTNILIHISIFVLFSMCMLKQRYIQLHIIISIHISTLISIPMCIQLYIQLSIHNKCICWFIYCECKYVYTYIYKYTGVHTSAAINILYYLTGEFIFIFIFMFIFMFIHIHIHLNIYTNKKVRQKSGFSV